MIIIIIVITRICIPLILALSLIESVKYNIEKKKKIKQNK